MKKMLLWALIISFFFTSCTSSQTKPFSIQIPGNTTTSSTSTQETIPAPQMVTTPLVVTSTINTITATDLYAEFKANQVAADLKYNNKKVTNIGFIADFGTELLGRPYVILGESWGGVQCIFPYGSEAVVATHVKGEVVIIQGTCESGLFFLHVLMGNCKFLDQNAIGTSTLVKPLTTTMMLPIPSSSKPITTTGPSVSVTNVAYQVIEKNSYYWKYSWKITLTNSSTIPITVDVEIQFLDAAGFELDVAYGWNLLVPANSNQDFTGSTLLTVTVAPNVSSAKAKIN